MEANANYSWLIKPAKVEFNNRYNICNQGYDRDDSFCTQSQMMSKRIDTLLKETRRMAARNNLMKSSQVNPTVIKNLKSNENSIELPYINHKGNKDRILKVSHRDHLSEIWTAMNHKTRSPTTSYREYHSFCNDMKEELKNKDKSYHIRQDKIFKIAFKK